MRVVTRWPPVTHRYCSLKIIWTLCMKCQVMWCMTFFNLSCSSNVTSWNVHHVHSFLFLLLSSFSSWARVNLLPVKATYLHQWPSVTRGLPSLHEYSLVTDQFHFTQHLPYILVIPMHSERLRTRMAISLAQSFASISLSFFLFFLLPESMGMLRKEEEKKS